MATRARQAGDRSVDAVERRRSRLARTRPSRGLGSGPAPIPTQDREEQMVLPLAFDAEVLASVTFLLETSSGQQRATGDVGWQTGGFDPMQAEPVEGKVEDERKCCRHIPLPSEGLADPITEARRLGNAAPQIGQADPADQRFVRSEDEKIIRLVGAPVLGVAGHPGAKT